jgi:hypothetical protein
VHVGVCCVGWKGRRYMEPVDRRFGAGTEVEPEWVSVGDTPSTQRDSESDSTFRTILVWILKRVFS